MNTDGLPIEMDNKTLSIPNLGNNRSTAVPKSYQFIGKEMQSVIAPKDDYLFHAGIVYREVVSQNDVIIKDEKNHTKDGKVVYQENDYKLESRL